MPLMLRNSAAFRTWLAIVGCATILLVTIYALVQQSTRLGADDLPLATAQIAQQKLNGGASPSDVIPAYKTDLRNDNTVFITITDSSKKVLATSASLDGQPALPPAGTFDYTAKHGTDRFSWQPDNGVRLATRMLTYKYAGTNGFVIAGQSLAQPEKRINSYTAFSFIAWLMIVGWSTLILFFKPTKSA